MALRLITPPAVEPISLVEAKAHLRVDHSDDDTLIGILIKASREYVDGKEGFLGRALITQTWELVIDEFPASEIKIPLPPLQSVVSIKYDDGNGDEQTLDPANYWVDDVSEPGWVVPILSGWPASLDAINAVRIRFICGYGDAGSDVDASIRAAMLLHLGSLYAHRETVIVGQTSVQLPWGAEQLLRPHRVLLGMA